MYLRVHIFACSISILNCCNELSAEVLTSILISYCSVCKYRPPPHPSVDPSNDFGKQLQCL